LNDRELQVTSCFVRHDVFLAQQTNTLADSRGALNWYHAVHDWALSRNHVRMLNRYSRSTDVGKYGVLLKARAVGLQVPDTVITNMFSDSCRNTHIRKPVAGGELTILLDDNPGIWQYPYFVQHRLYRPEMRVYRIGNTMRAFEIHSTEVDYRRTHQVDIRAAQVPADIADGLIRLCDDLGLDFAAADFMLNNDQSWVFLEVNSQPMFVAFDAVLGGELSDLLIDWLIAPPPGGALSAPALESMIARP
jgi:hypothetical protein